MSHLAVEPVPVKIVKTPEELTELAVEFGAWNTWTVPAIGTNTGTLAPILSRRVSRDEAEILIPTQSSGATSVVLAHQPGYLSSAANPQGAIIPVQPTTVTTTPPVPSTPAIPASTTNVQNTNSFPVTVVITGGTMTNVSVQGQTVGTGAGTYLVPSGQVISMTYTVAPTWAWSNANPATTVTNYSLQRITYKAQQPLYAVGVGGPVTLFTLDQAQAAASSQAEEAMEYIPEEYQEEGQGGTGPSYR